PGSLFIHAFLHTVRLPHLNPVNEQFKHRLAALCGAGYDYTYLYPGLQKVVQAAGRVIRSQSDNGVVMLIDDRFAEPKVTQLFPAWWRPQTSGS
ncbi:ATP-dependent DNA helicase, partial [Pseudomonas syringae]